MSSAWSRPPAEMFYDVSADGRRFLVTREASGTSSAPGRMVLVQNWESELSEQQGR